MHLQRTKHNKKKYFCTEVTLLLDRISNSKVKIILRTLRLEKRKFRPAISTHSLHDITNGNGKKLEDLAVGNGHKIESTMVPHKDIHKSTLITLDNTYLNQIDYVLISEKFTNNITDVRPYT